MLEKLIWMHVNEIQNKISGVLLCNDVIVEILCRSVKLLALAKLSSRKRIWLPKNEIEFLRIKLNARKWSWMAVNEIACIFFEIDTGVQKAINFVAKLKDHSLIWIKNYEIGRENLFFGSI